MIRAYVEFIYKNVKDISNDDLDLLCDMSYGDIVHINTYYAELVKHLILVYAMSTYDSGGFNIYCVVDDESDVEKLYNEMLDFIPDDVRNIIMKNNHRLDECSPHQYSMLLGNTLVCFVAKDYMLNNKEYPDKIIYLSDITDCDYDKFRDNINIKSMGLTRNV